MTHQQNLVTLTGKPLDLGVHLGHQRAGGVERREIQVFGALPDGWRDAVRGENEIGPARDLVGLVHKDHATFGELLHHMLVVDDLLAHVQGRTMLFQCLLDGLDGPVDAGTVATRFGE